MISFLHQHYWWTALGCAIAVVIAAVRAQLDDDAKWVLNRIPHAIVNLANRRVPVDRRAEVVRRRRARLHAILRRESRLPSLRLLHGIVFALHCLLVAPRDPAADRARPEPPTRKAPPIRAAAPVAAHTTSANPKPAAQSPDREDRILRVLFRSWLATGLTGLLLSFFGEASSAATGGTTAFWPAVAHVGVGMILAAAVPALAVLILGSVAPVVVPAWIVTERLLGRLPKDAAWHRKAMFIMLVVVIAAVFAAIFVFGSLLLIRLNGP